MRTVPDEKPRSIAPMPRLSWVLVGLIGVEVGAFYAILSGNGWAYDDNLSMEYARRATLNWHWLSSNLFGHFEPAHRAIFSLLTAVMPIDERVATIAMLALLVAAIVLLERSLRMIVGAGWVPVLATGYMGFSVLLVPQLQWFSSGSEAIPTLALDLLCLWAYLRFQRERRIRWVILCAGTLAVGLAFYEKPLFIILYLVLVRAVLLPGRLSVRRVLSALRQDWPVWLALGAVAAAYFVVREASGSGSIASAGSASIGEWLSFARAFWIEGLAPSAFGLTIPASGPSPLQVAAVIACQVGILAAIVLSVRQRRRAWRAWAALGVCVLATLVLVGAGRLATFGPSVGGDSHYLSDFAWLVPLMAAIAWAGPATDGGTPEPARRRGWKRPGVVITALALSVYAVASALTAIHLQARWPGGQARQWEGNVEASLQAAAERGRPVVIAEGVMPSYIVESAFTPYNQLSYLMPLYGRDVKMAGPITGALWTVTPSGRLRPASVESPIANSPPLSHKCGTASAKGASIRWTWPSRVIPSTASAYLRITYDSHGEDLAPLYLNHVPSGYFGAPDDLAELDAGSDTSLVWLGSSPSRGVLMGLIPGTGVCVRRLAVVELRATQGR